MASVTTQATHTGLAPLNASNRLGLVYRHEAALLPWFGPIWDVHTHINSVEAARAVCEVADLYQVERIWSMTQLEQIDPIRQAFGSRISFIAVPNYITPMSEEEFSTDWLQRIEAFAEKGVKICKFWSAPRGRDLRPGTQLGQPASMEAMRLAHSLGMMFMTHVGDPDTWFLSYYRDAARYGSKQQQYPVFERLLDEYGDIPWIAAHMGGDPENLDHLQQLLDRHANLYLDTSATKWMVRELSKQPAAVRDFCRHNSGRLLFGSDIVASPADTSFDLFASRYWALRTLFETDYDGPSPIVDPDLPMLNSSLPADSTAHLAGCRLDPPALATLYSGAARSLFTSFGIAL